MTRRYRAAAPMGQLRAAQTSDSATSAPSPLPPVAPTSTSRAPASSTQSASSSVSSALVPAPMRPGRSTTCAVARRVSTAGRGSAPAGVVMLPASRPQRTATSSQPPLSRRRAAMRCGQTSSGRARSARCTPRRKDRSRAVHAPASS